ncbi:MAG: hypothetical protein SPI30_10535 [Prevotella sp.]|nr:hypothetical protein [Prevotella sp.]
MYTKKTNQPTSCPKEILFEQQEAIFCHKAKCHWGRTASSQQAVWTTVFSCRTREEKSKRDKQKIKVMFLF